MERDEFMDDPTPQARGLLRRSILGLTIAAVVAVYVYSASRGTFSFRRIAPEKATERTKEFASYYPALAEGFLRGQLDMPYEVDPRWAKVTNVYDFDSRAAHGLEWEMWDATFYNGRFYLYFSPVPVLLFYIPFRLVAGGYPPDALVAAAAATWAFLLCVAFARRALRGRRLLVPFEVWVVLIGVANVLPYTLTSVRAYEVAVATGMAFTASWAYALLRWTETGAVRHATLMSLWLALAITTRPNLIVLALITALVLIGRKNLRAMLAAALVATVIGGAAAAYNYARFGNPLEFGVTYQISYEPMWRHPFCGVCDRADALRFVNNVLHYVAWAPSITSKPPFVELQRNVMDPAASFPGGAEPVGGIGVLNPLILLGTTFMLLFARRRDPAAAVMGGAWVLLFALATCRWVTARYSLDFMLLMIAASAVAVEDGLTVLDRAGVRVMLLRVLVIVLAIYAIVVGVLLGGPRPVE